MIAVISRRKRELFTLVLLPQLCDDGSLEEEERVVIFGFVAPTMCWQ